MQLGKSILILLIIFLSCHAYADVSCFIMKENNQVLAQEGDCLEAHPPFSTFKIPLSLMAFDAGILIDTTHPEWTPPKNDSDWSALWKTNQTPTSWILNTKTWYSQKILQMLGADKFKKYIVAFDYGNKDVSGDPGQNNGLTRSWLGSSLKISGVQQIAFIQKILERKLPVSVHAYEMTQKLLFCEIMSNGWTLYSKSALVLEKENPSAWDVGWVEKDGRKIAFALYIENDDHIATPLRDRVRKLAIDKIRAVLDKKNPAEAG